MIRRVLLGLSLLVALDARPQTYFSETLEIRVTNVDVIVTTKDGKPATGLTRDDFEIYEDGVKKEISNFLEIRGDGGAAGSQPAGDGRAESPPLHIDEAQTDARRRNILVFIDNAGLHPLARNALLPHLRQFIEKTMRPGDELTLATWNRSLKATTLARADRPSVEEAVHDLSLQTGTYLRAALRRQCEEELQQLLSQSSGKPPFQAGIGITRMRAMQAVHEMQAKTEALKSLMAASRGADGRKILVLITQTFSTNPAEELFMYLDSIRDRFEGGGSASVIAEMRELNLPHLAAQIAEMANSSGISLYPIDASGKLSDLDFADASTDRTIANTGPSLTINTTGPLMSAIAEATGGRAMTGSSNWQLAFDTIANDLTSYYSLGYRSDGEREDRLRKIVVKSKNRQNIVRTRHAVVERTLVSEMSDAVAANLFREPASNDLGIRVAAGSADASAAGVVVPITISIPTNTLTLVPDGDDLTGRLSIFAAFVRNDGAVSKTARQEQRFRFPAASLERRKEITVKLDVSADAHTEGISVGVMDGVSHATGFGAVKWIR